MAVWNPWRGCHRHSEGCKYCYIHKGDASTALHKFLSNIRRYYSVIYAMLYQGVIERKRGEKT